MQLTAEQQRLVEENMGLVGKVIKDKVHPTVGIFTYEDLYQIGCIGLCKAAATDKGGCFSTYAYRLIWNEICDALIRATRQSQRECSLEEIVSHVTLDDRPLDQISRMELQIVIQKAKQRASGTTAKGIECLELSVAGYKSREIGALMDADPSAVRMWMTKARRFLMAQPDIQDAFEEMMGKKKTDRRWLMHIALPILTLLLFRTILFIGYVPTQSRNRHLRQEAISLEPGLLVT